MRNKHLFIAAVVVTITGTVGMASWLAVDSGEVRGRAPLAQPVSDAGGSAQARGVSETEAAVLPPPSPVADQRVEPAAPSEATRPAVAVPTPRVAPPKTVPAPEWKPPAAQRASAPETPVEPAQSTEPGPVAAPAPEVPQFVQVTIPSNAVIGVRLSTAVSSETAELEDRVEAAVTRDVIADGRVAVPAGTRLLGSVSEVTRGGKFREKARLAVRFHTLVLADGTRESVRVDSIVRDGDSPVRDSATKVGVGAAGGAIIGGIMGGRKGALLGGVAGAGAGVAATAAGDRSIATLTAGSPLSLRLMAPVTVMIDKLP